MRALLLTGLCVVCVLLCVDVIQSMLKDIRGGKK